MWMTTTILTPPTCQSHPLLVCSLLQLMSPTDSDPTPSLPSSNQPQLSTLTLHLQYKWLRASGGKKLAVKSRKKVYPMYSIQLQMDNLPTMKILQWNRPKLNTSLPSQTYSLSLCNKTSTLTLNIASSCPPTFNFASCSAVIINYNLHN